MKIGIIGCAGRMGKTLVEEILGRNDCTLSGGTERASSPLIGTEIAPGSKVKVSDNIEKLVEMSDAVIDFTKPEVSLNTAEFCAKHKRIHIIGTTGFSDQQRKLLEICAKETAILISSNMSVGVNLLQMLVEKVASVLGDEFDIEIVEMHHRKKVDAPSGTALSLGEAAAKGRKVSLDKVATKSREGITGERNKGEVGFATLRGGDVVGDHTVIFAGDGERIELTHKASNRTIYAKGAVRAALWAKGKKPGLYSISDVLDL